MKLTKKLTALFLTLAMALSLCVCVNASDLTALPSAAQTSESEITSEVSPTSTVYKLVFPTASDNVFDFILDPSNLIRNTHAAAYSNATFNDTAGHLFFKNTDATDDDPATYSGSSNSVTVTNKSNVPVNVTLTTSLTGLSADDYTFSATDDLSSADGPAIYLAMESECVDSNEEAWDYTLPEVTYVNDDYIGIFDTVAFAWDDEITTAVEAAADADADDAIAAGTAANALKDAFNTALAEGLKIEIDYTHLAPDDEETAVMTATPKAVTLDGYTFTFDESAYPLNPDVADEEEDEAVVATLTVATTDTSPVNIGAFTFTFKADLDTDTDYLEDATVSVSVAAGSQVINEATPVAADDSAVKAEVTRLLPGVPNAYELTYDATAKAYVYAEKEDCSIPYKSFSFNLTGKINDDDGWSSITGTPTIAVTWNMTAVGAEEEDDGNEPETPQVTPPTLTVTTGIASNTASGVWTIDVGTSGMTKVASAKVGTKSLTVTTGSTGAAGKANYVYNADAGTITVYHKASTTYTMALFKNATITLADDDGNQYTLASFDGATANGEFTLTAVGE